MNGMKFKHFSDCIVLSAFQSPEGLLEIFHGIELLTLNLLQYDILVRGGLARGGAHHDDDILFGMGVNRAYELEGKAVSPRIVIAEYVIRDADMFLNNGWTALESFITRDDEDGLSFVNYFRQFAAYDPNASSYPGMVVLSYPGRRIVDFLCNRLNITSDERVRKKIKWLQGYWNGTVAINGAFKRIEAGVLERDHVRPTTIVRRRNG